MVDRRLSTEPCGTHNGYSRHLYRGETPCDACRLAHNARMRAYYRARKAAGYRHGYKSPRVASPGSD